jgi:cation-transporting ATPase 13A1
MYTSEKKTFTVIPYPVDDLVGDYQESVGIEHETQLQKVDLVYGPNKMSIPIPDFFEIYKEHMVAPFFVFQLFTSALWLLDEYWYFTLMSLAMLFIFEGTVVM